MSDEILKFNMDERAFRVMLEFNVKPGDDVLALRTNSELRRKLAAATGMQDLSIDTLFFQYEREYRRQGIGEEPSQLSDGDDHWVGE